MKAVSATELEMLTFLSDHLRHLMQTDLTILMSVRSIMIFSMPSIFSVRLKGLLTNNKKERLGAPL